MGTMAMDVREIVGRLARADEREHVIGSAGTGADVVSDGTGVPSYTYE
jgi:hypothetical protein